MVRGHTTIKYQLRVIVRGDDWYKYGVLKHMMETILVKLDKC